MKQRLCRFRVDPSTVRVSIRHETGFWVVTVQARGNDQVKVMASHSSPERAVTKALRKAHNALMIGINADLEWAYVHPWPAGPLDE